MDILRGLLGITVLILFCLAFSNNRKAVDWKLVGIGLIIQILLALLILKGPGVSWFFEQIAGFFVKLIDYSDAGARFIFGNLTDANNPAIGYIFAFKVLPTILFYSAVSAILYYYGVLQKIIYGMAWFMSRFMGLSGPESLAAAANVFIGQTEAPLIVKPYLEKFSRSEIMCLMTGGMATIAGGVFAAYIGFLGGDDPESKLFFAKHLLAASLISAPAAIVTAKILYPETEKKDIDKQMEMADTPASNVLDAISQGTTDGLKLAVNVAAMLIVFIALIAMANEILSGTVGRIGGLNEMVIESTGGRFEGFTFTYLLGLIFAPVAWLLGTPSQDMVLIGQLLGQKTVLNEFIAYAELGNMQASGIELLPKSKLIATYALCGFSNFASIGIQIGGIGAIAPGQRKTLTELGIKALIGGTVACFLTAAVAGMLM